MENASTRPLVAGLVALPETAGSALYGMVDVLGSAGSLWNELVGEEAGRQLIEPHVVSPTTEPFRCGNGIPVSPDLSVADDPHCDIVIVPEIWLAPSDALDGRHDDVKRWVRSRYEAGAAVYSACSGAILLASTGLLDGREATSHWGYIDLFRERFPAVRFRPEPNLVIADGEGRLVTAGGTTSWHDLALHIVARHCGPGEAMRIAKVYLLKWHGEGQLPFAALVRRQPHADAAIRRVEEWLTNHFAQSAAVGGAVEASGLAERTLKRRFKAATGVALIDYVQNLRIEEAKRLLEEDAAAVDEIAAEVGYDNAAFFRRLFKRLTGLNPGEYRRMFRPIASA
ncbi:helix-turn-helix domain-containing protein [Altererythrobacter salegens]|uniref:Helix-turn-helix domain-containing protein n=1 Tax=Croceibacterium salegens TaxID=1737568 RepID=A0A6I4SY27_9SPHN|nr:helix-turn-helix domain-containing protein [Croceibacterium salegens]MXO59927.1 helix-turn-helix domain-containing protein [Croceibacterium salegens]